MSTINNKFLKRIIDKRENIYNYMVLCGVILTASLMYYRVFFGAELTDAAYYVAEAKEILNGNIPFVYNYSSKAVGFTFILVVIEAVYSLFVPNLEGVVLFCELCFVTYKIFISLAVYFVFRGKVKTYYALLLSGLLIVVDGYLQQFSYNYVPEFNIFLAGCLLYDAIEHNATRKKMKIICAGILVAIGLFANPGYGAALLIFFVLIIVRIDNMTGKIKALQWFCGSIIAIFFLVGVSIVMPTSSSELCYGIYRLFINPIPMDSLNPDKTWLSVLGSFKKPILDWVIVFFPVSILAYLFSKRYMCENGIRLSTKQCITFSITAAMFTHILYLCYVYKGDVAIVSMWGFSAVCFTFVFLAAKEFCDDQIIWYLGIFPIAYAIAGIVLVSNGANIGRFVNAYIVIIPIFYKLFTSKTELVRIMSSLLCVVVIISYGYLGFHYVYRDSNFHSLTTKVESGVYKGIYTTPARAHDLPELEEYLNSIIGADEAYAFRDNVPSAYLMVHNGKVCDISTWDILQHTYHRNSPAVLFDYYRVRKMIPDKIIYIDYGRDKNLSNIDPDYRYNDWVNEYYDLVDDFKLNETFFHVVVYKYNGSFDGNYQWWIDNYWELVK